MRTRNTSTLACALLLLGQAVVWPVCARAAGLEDMPVSLRLEGEASLPGYFAAIEETYRVTVACDGCPETREPGQGRVDGPLREVLRLVAERFGVTSYAVDFDDGRRAVSIRVLGQRAPANAAAAPRPSGDAQPAAAAPGPGTGLDTEVTPPAGGGQPAATLRQVESVAEKNLLRQDASDPLDEIVIPPMAEGETGLTARQVNALREQVRQTQEQLDPLDQDATPPDAEGGPAMTRRQVEALRSQNRQAQADPLDAEVLPPDRDGKAGVTLRQLRASAARTDPAGQRPPVEADRPPSVEDEAPGPVGR